MLRIFSRFSRKVPKATRSSRSPRNSIDWILVLALIPILLAGLVTMYSFTGLNPFFTRQLVWIAVALLIFFTLNLLDYRFLRRTSVVVGLYGGVVILLLFLFVAGTVVGGAQSWFQIFGFSIQPAVFAQLIIIILLAKYFSRRHIEIKRFSHIVVSGLYMFILFALVFLQPDFGSALIIALIWLGMVLVAGISKKHLLVLALGSVLVLGCFWVFGFTPEQKSRITTFVNPTADLQGAGYHARQSTIAVGSGRLLGKGIGQGTQSRLEFLPEYETDFIFAAFAEEWGFVGILLLLGLYGVVLWRILLTSVHGESNFERLFGAGVAIYFMSHILFHVGINMGLLPVTGTTIPFMSYGGSHLVTEFAALGILMGMRRYGRSVHPEDISTGELTYSV